MAVLTFIFNLAVFGLPAAAAAFISARLAAGSHDEWKVLAWVPVAPLALWAPSIAWAVTRDRTSHNLWPFELLLWGLLTLTLFGGFLLARRIANRPGPDWRSRRDRDRTT